METTIQNGAKTLMTEEQFKKFVKVQAIYLGLSEAFDLEVVEEAKPLPTPAPAIPTSAHNEPTYTGELFPRSILKNEVQSSNGAFWDAPFEETDRQTVLAYFRTNWNNNDITAAVSRIAASFMRERNCDPDTAVRLLNKLFETKLSPHFARRMDNFNQKKNDPAEIGRWLININDNPSGKKYREEVVL